MMVTDLQHFLARHAAWSISWATSSKWPLPVMREQPGRATCHAVDAPATKDLRPWKANGRTVTLEA